MEHVLTSDASLRGRVITTIGFTKTEERLLVRTLEILGYEWVPEVNFAETILLNSDNIEEAALFKKANAQWPSTMLFVGKEHYGFGSEWHLPKPFTKAELAKKLFDVRRKTPLPTPTWPWLHNDVRHKNVSPPKITTSQYAMLISEADTWKTEYLSIKLRPHYDELYQSIWGAHQEKYVKDLKAFFQQEGYPEALYFINLASNGRHGPWPPAAIDQEKLTTQMYLISPLSQVVFVAAE